MFVELAGTHPASGRGSAVDIGFETDRGASGADPALRLLVTSTTRSFAEETTEAIAMRTRLLGVSTRYARCGIEQRAGHP